MLRLLNNFDFFGTKIFLRFRGKQEFKTKLGFSITFIIGLVICIRLSFIITDAYQRLNPIVIFKERQVKSPSLFTVDHSNVTIAFGMQNPNDYSQYINSKIYTVSISQTTMLTVLNATTQEKEVVWQNREIKIAPCKPDNFQNADTRDYFLNINYQDLYCMDPNEHAEMEGDYNADVFSFFQIQVKKCIGNDCASPEEISNMLLKGFFAIYYTDIMIDPVQKEKPFQYYARDIYWLTSTDLPRDTTLLFRNSYIESDFGWVSEDIQTQYHGQFSQIEHQYLPNSFDKYFFQLTFRFEKQKENVYQRKYKSIIQIVSEIGGFTQVLLTIGYIICTKISQLYLNKTIINEAFNFRTANDDRLRSKSEIKMNKKDELNQFKMIQENKINQEMENINLNKDIHSKQVSVNYQNQENQQPILSIKQNQHQKQLPISNNSEKINSKLQRQSLVNENPGDKDYNLTDNKLLSGFQEINLQDKKKQSENLESHSDIQKISASSKVQNTQSFNQINGLANNKKLQTVRNRNNSQNQSQQCQMLLSSIIQNKKLQSFETQIDPNILISENNRKKAETIDKQIDDCKFKKFLQNTTNSMKFSVFEYIKFFIWPFGRVLKKKQVIDYSIDKLYYHLDVLNLIKKLLEVEKLKKLIMDNDQIQLFEYISKPTIREEDIFNQNNSSVQNEFDIQYQDNRTEIQKLQDAYKAYQNVKSRDQKSHFDKKLINFIDPNLIELFNINLDNSKDISQITDTNISNINGQQQQISGKYAKEIVDQAQCYKSSYSPVIQSKFFPVCPITGQNVSDEEKIDTKPKQEGQDDISILSDVDIPIENFQQNS